MSDGIEYRIRSETLAHAGLASRIVSRYNTRKTKESNRSSSTQAIIGRTWGQEGQRKTNPYGNYKSPYYDPVKRHEYYEAHKDHVTRPYGTGGTSSKSGSKGSKGSSKGSAKSGSGRGGGSSAQAKQNLTDAINKLKEESALNTAAQQEATKRKIEDLREELAEHAEKLRSQGAEAEETLNTAEIRGRIQELQDEVKKAGIDLSSWIANEKESLARRIAALTGTEYSSTARNEYEQQLESKNKEISSRADAIYKRKKQK